MIIYEGYVIPFFIKGFEEFAPVAPEDVDRLFTAYNDGLALSLKSEQLEKLDPSIQKDIGSLLEEAAIKSNRPVQDVKMSLQAITKRGIKYSEQIEKGES